MFFYVLIMNRKTWLKKSGLAAASLTLSPFLISNKKPETTPFLRVAHITDVHVRPENGIPARLKSCLHQVLSNSIDFILNGGDTIHAADYDDITRERVIEQWDAWDDTVSILNNYEMYSCIGNHDMWWAAPDENDPMYGKKYVVERLGIPDRYYSFTKENWHFFILDGNNAGVTLDDKQFNWLQSGLEKMPIKTHALIMSHHPILTVTGKFYPNDQHSDADKLSRLFFEHKDKVRACISGHMHLLDYAKYNGVDYYCNGAMSGFWWGEGNERSAGRGYYHETPPGFVILKLYEDGRVERNYIVHNY